jgi:hypothetical protein
MIKIFAVLALALASASAWLPASNFQVAPLLNTNLNAVAYNNINDTFATDCLSFYFSGGENNTVSLNTTLWANPKPENFTFTYSSSQPAVWTLHASLTITWVYADYVNEVYAFADSTMMTTYVLAANWNVSSVWVIRAIGAVVLSGVPILPNQFSLAPANCSSYP